MATPTWEPGKLYAPGSLVVPRTSAPPVSTVLTNPGFDSGSTDWTLGSGVSINTGYGYTNNTSMQFSGTGGVVQPVHAKYPVTPGKAISGSCAYAQGLASSGQNTAACSLYWYDAAGVLLPGAAGRTGGTLVSTSSGGTWKASTVSGVAPPGSAFVAIGIYCNRTNSALSFADNFQWDYAIATPPAGIVYRATQAATGYSATTEPVWPAVGASVVDNEVTWQGVLASRVTWVANPILKSGATEPAWPTASGSQIADGTVNWRVTSRRVEDENCPNSKVVAIIASKVFAEDEDIVRFSATTNPLDWTSEEDAGFLPTGLQQSNASYLSVLAPYRSNLLAMNAGCLQNWQVDPDPSLMSPLDQMEGVGSVWQQAAQAVANDMLYLSQRGVRSIGVAAGSNSLAAQDAGQPVDPLVAAAIADAVTRGTIPVATYYPSQGQYWLAFPGYGGAAQTTVFVLTMNGGAGKWSRYVFPFVIETFAQLGDTLYIRHGDYVSAVDESLLTDQNAGGLVAFGGEVWWPYLDFQSPGVTKMMQGFDIVATGRPSLSIGYDERNLAAFTSPYELDPDTLPGGMVPFPVSAPSFSLKVTFAGDLRWSLNAVYLTVADFRTGA